MLITKPLTMALSEASLAEGRRRHDPWSPRCCTVSARAQRRALRHQAGEPIQLGQRDPDRRLRPHRRAVAQWRLSQPLPTVQDFGGARREVFLDFGVVVGEDALDVGVGFGAVALSVAGGDEVQQGDVFAAACLQGDMGSAGRELWFAGGEVVGGDDVCDVDDHAGVDVVEGVVGEPPVALRSAFSERHTDDQVERGPQVGDAVGSAGGAA